MTRLSSVERMLVCVGVPSRVKTPEFGGLSGSRLPCHPLSLSHAACGPYPHLTSLLFAPPSPASNAQYIVSGSDDGSFFVWEKETTNLVRVLQGDESIVNCLQPHPSYCFLATSGIDPVVRLWNPRPEVRGRAGWQKPGWEERRRDALQGLQLSLCGAGWERSHSLTEARGCQGRSSLPRGPSCVRAGASEF